MRNQYQYMNEALIEAKLAELEDEVPVGAVVVFKSKIIGRGHNTVISDNSVTSHAEINAILEASNFLKNYRLNNCDMYVTLEPCHMCAKAIVDARINKVFFAAPEPKTGAIISIDSFFEKSFLNHRVKSEFGLMKDDSVNLLRAFFKKKRNKDR